ncbi:hypothetical protein FB451DRAFT_1518068 [Mycena latifolia]|nr:hypothetical protein FB451DRAFT_1518068 [Mycena latifolia]
MSLHSPSLGPLPPSPPPFAVMIPTPGKSILKKPPPPQASRLSLSHVLPAGDTKGDRAHHMGEKEHEKEKEEWEADFAKCDARAETPGTPVSRADVRGGPRARRAPREYVMCTPLRPIPPRRRRAHAEVSHSVFTDDLTRGARPLRGDAQPTYRMEPVHTSGSRDISLRRQRARRLYSGTQDSMPTVCPPFVGYSEPARLRKDGHGTYCAVNPPRILRHERPRLASPRVRLPYMTHPGAPSTSGRRCEARRRLLHTAYMPRSPVPLGAPRSGEAARARGAAPVVPPTVMPPRAPCVGGTLAARSRRIVAASSESGAREASLQARSRNVSRLRRNAAEQIASRRAPFAAVPNPAGYASADPLYCAPPPTLRRERLKCQVLRAVMYAFPPREPTPLGSILEEACGEDSTDTSAQNAQFLCSGSPGPPTRHEQYIASRGLLPPSNSTFYLYHQPQKSQHSPLRLDSTCQSAARFFVKYNSLSSSQPPKTLNPLARRSRGGPAGGDGRGAGGARGNDVGGNANDVGAVMRSERMGEALVDAYRDEMGARPLMTPTERRGAAAMNWGAHYVGAVMRRR